MVHDRGRQRIDGPIYDFSKLIAWMRMKKKKYLNIRNFDFSSITYRSFNPIFSFHFGTTAFRQSFNNSRLVCSNRWLIWCDRDLRSPTPKRLWSSWFVIVWFSFEASSEFFWSTSTGNFGCSHIWCQWILLEVNEFAISLISWISRVNMLPRSSRFFRVVISPRFFL